MIFLKWSTDWVAIGQQPPSLLNTLISMFMAPGVYTEESRLFAHQEQLQLLLVTMALLAVPPLLLGTPLLALLENRRKTKTRAYHVLAAAPERGGERGVGAGEGGRAAGEEDEKEFDFGEVMVHQVRRVCAVRAPCVRTVCAPCARRVCGGGAVAARWRCACSAHARW